METKIKITIERFTENPDYQEQYKDWKEHARYGNMNVEPPNPYVSHTCLKTELTEDEFQAVKKACLEVM